MQTPCVTLDYRESNFGYGTLRDHIIIERRTNHLQLWRELNPVLIFSFVEGILGYDMLEAAGGGFGGRYHFKRTAPYE